MGDRRRIVLKLSGEALASSASDETIDASVVERIAAEIASALLKGGVLPGPVFARGIAKLGRDGLEHLVYIVAQYCIVSITLNAFDVPSEDS